MEWEVLEAVAQLRYQKRLKTTTKYSVRVLGVWVNWNPATPKYVTACNGLICPAR
jgi:hypothetical protein